MRPSTMKPPIDDGRVTAELLDEWIGDCEAPMGESFSAWHARKLREVRSPRPMIPSVVKR